VRQVTASTKRPFGDGSPIEASLQIQADPKE
jgi:hypothetical protein